MLLCIVFSCKENPKEKTPTTESTEETTKVSDNPLIYPGFKNMIQILEIVSKLS